MESAWNPLSKYKYVLRDYRLPTLHEVCNLKYGSTSLNTLLSWSSMEISLDRILQIWLNCQTTVKCCTIWTCRNVYKYIKCVMLDINIGLINFEVYCSSNKGLLLQFHKKHILFYTGIWMRCNLLGTRNSDWDEAIEQFWWYFSNNLRRNRGRL